MGIKPEKNHNNDAHTPGAEILRGIGSAIIGEVVAGGDSHSHPPASNPKPSGDTHAHGH